VLFYGWYAGSSGTTVSLLDRLKNIKLKISSSIRKNISFIENENLISTQKIIIKPEDSTKNTEKIHSIQDRLKTIEPSISIHDAIKKWCQT
jgi:hypothetical protein